MHCLVHYSALPSALPNPNPNPPLPPALSVIADGGGGGAADQRIQPTTGDGVLRALRRKGTDQSLARPQVETKPDMAGQSRPSGQSNPSGGLAEAGRSLGQPEA